ncbi:hypothetical protein [Gordonia shandongensis]|uniref:hypothetical protein n=1 Tax=Gordonia shandongensis TaxID=376351 RepID=UPI0003FBDD00|nr:hypothetical protein [Gordonia shandongensis]
MTGPHLPTSQHPGPTPPGAPEARPERPDTITLALQFWVAIIVFEIASRIADYGAISEEMRRMAKQMTEKSGDQQLLDNLDVLIVVSFAMSIVLLTLLAAALMWGTWSGYNWTRLLLGWLSAFVVVQLAFGIFGLFSDDGPEMSTWSMIPAILGGVCAVGALATLMHRDSTAYCREVAAHRARKRQNGVR